MKILILSGIYKEIEKIFFYKHKDLINQPYSIQKEVFDKEYFCYTDLGWLKAFEKLGYDTENFIINLSKLQYKWASEHISEHRNFNMYDIVIEQIKYFNPDILWFNYKDYNLLKKIKDKCTNIKLFIGWSGSALVERKQWKLLDIILCCAPETVEIFKNMGLNVYHLNAAFNPEVLNFLNKKKSVQEDLIFIGSIVRGKQFHLKREELLIKLKDLYSLKIYSPSYYINDNLLKLSLKRYAYTYVNLLKKIGLSRAIEYIPILKKVLLWDSEPQLSVNPLLKRCLNPPMFGLDMFNTIMNAKYTLNMHADSSYKYASNMRLFETTGVGGCLITDYKDNLNTLFDIDNDIITYKTSDELVEKIKWLDNNEKKRKEIILNGQKTCLKRHTYQHRVNELEKIIKKYI